MSENRMALYNLASTGLIAAINFVTIPVFTRTLGTAGFGVVSIYLAWVQISTVLVGLKADGSIGSANANLGEDEQKSYHFSILVLALVSFVALSSIAALFIGPLSQLLRMDSVLIMGMMFHSFGAFVISTFNMRFIFLKEGRKAFSLSVSVVATTTILSVALIFMMFDGVDRYYGRVFGLVVPNIVIGLTLFLRIALSRDANFNVRYWRFCLALSVPLMFHGLSQLLLAQAGNIAIQQVHGNSAAGTYSAALTIVALMSAIYAALNNAFVPFMYDDLAGKTTTQIKRRHFDNYMRLFTAGTCAFVMMAPDILRALTPRAFWSSVDVLPLLVIGQYCVFLYSFPVNYEFFRMKTRWIALGTVMAAGVNITLAVVLVPRYSIVGAAVSTMISYFVLFLFHFCIARLRLNDRNYPSSSYFTGLSIVVAVCILYYPLASTTSARWLIGFVILGFGGSRLLRTRMIF